MMTGLDLFKRRTGSIKRAIDNAPQAYRSVAGDWAQDDWLPYAQNIAPVDTGAFRDGLTFEIGDNQINLQATAPHSSYVEEGTSVSIAQPTVKPAAEATRPKLSARFRDHFRRTLK